MRILLPTGAATEEAVRRAAAGFDADVIVTGKVASFLTPHALSTLIKNGAYDAVVVSGMCTVSFAHVERETGVPIYLGSRDVTDLAWSFPLLKPARSRVPSPPMISLQQKMQKMPWTGWLQRRMRQNREFVIRDVKIGGNSRMKVLAEIMDAPKVEDIRARTEHYFLEGADIVDIGFGFDATPQEVERIFGELADIDRPLAVDTQDPALIRVALSRADLVLSLQEKNNPHVAREIARAGAAAVVVPGERSLKTNIAQARVRELVAL